MGRSAVHRPVLAGAASLRFTNFKGLIEWSSGKSVLSRKFLSCGNLDDAASANMWLCSSHHEFRINRFPARSRWDLITIMRKDQGKPETMR